LVVTLRVVPWHVPRRKRLCVSQIIGPVVDLSEEQEGPKTGEGVTVSRAVIVKGIT